ncbi:hypothetical protein DHEL01_v212735 [Diaporthe helianthi]|uniref:Uncharacterized protein n=1 Tax=Diaporthe helianthi TaxID=158607 RepID=A0A2P5HF40_DIAHE|nr:hypothetical protein DHEL01_v212735 [Diaporthe helianthi]
MAIFKVVVGKHTEQRSRLLYRNYALTRRYYSSTITLSGRPIGAAGAERGADPTAQEQAWDPVPAHGRRSSSWRTRHARLAPVGLRYVGRALDIAKAHANTLES